MSLYKLIEACLAQNEKWMTPLGTEMVLVSLLDPTTCIHTLAEHGCVPHLGEGNINTCKSVTSKFQTSEHN